MDRKYNQPAAVQFVEDMEGQYDVEHYSGYSYYEGPAVRANDHREFQDIIRSTDVFVKWDGLGSGWIIYPEYGDIGVPIDA